MLAVTSRTNIVDVERVEAEWFGMTQIGFGGIQKIVTAVRAERVSPWLLMLNFGHGPC
jgi:hypothetical protein